MNMIFKIGHSRIAINMTWKVIEGNKMFTYVVTKKIFLRVQCQIQLYPIRF